MKIGNIEFADPFMSLAPLAGYGDIAFRRLCCDYGASLTVTEMISVKGLVYGNEKTENMLCTAPNEKTTCVQLFGSDPEYFCRALQLDALKKFDIIDINMGCPVPKVTKCGEGSALMRDFERAADIVRACVQSGGGRPVTVKHRTGWRDDTFTAPQFAEKMQAAGASAITVHGRSAEQGYSGVADWDKIEAVAHAVSIPVIGNGDIVCRADVERVIRGHGVSGVAVGRGALGHPHIFAAQCEDDLAQIMLRHIEYALQYFPAPVAVRTMRKHIVKYLAGVAGTKELRVAVNSITDPEELKAAVATVDRRV